MIPASVSARLGWFDSWRKQRCSRAIAEAGRRNNRARGPEAPLNKRLLLMTAGAITSVCICFAQRTPAAKWRMPSVAVIQSRASRPLPLEKTQLAQTKTKPASLASLAADSVVTQAIQAGVGSATLTAASHISSGAGNMTMQQVGSIFSAVLAHRKPAVTYVWGVPGAASGNVLRTAAPRFAVRFANAPGVNPNEFAPEIVRLTPAQNICRLVGATRGKEDAQSRDAVDWEVYSSFVEDPVAVTLQRIQAGEYRMSPQSPLLPGEYAVVLRPVAKSKKFSGGEVARAQGDGLMFDAVWSFQVADGAQ